MKLGKLISDKKWVSILNITQPGGDNWQKFKNKKSGGCLKTCPAWIKCAAYGPDKTICSDSWKESNVTRENLNILFHIYNEFEHYNQKDQPKLTNESKAIKELRQFLTTETQKIIKKEKITLEEEDEFGLGTEDLRKMKIHKRAERNQGLAKKAKMFHRYKCQACEFDFEKVYGKIGKDYIEAHHLKPIPKLKGKVVELDPKNDFGVLCANCHRMIHRTLDVGSIDEFKRKYLKKR